MDLKILDGLAALNKLRVLFPGAIIAGGFLRDLYFGKPVKDVDVFVPHQGGFETFEGFTRVCAGEYMNASEVAAVWSTPWNVGGLPLSIIEMAPDVDPVSRVAFHDFDFCQVWTDGQAIHGTHDLGFVKRTQCVTLMHCEDRAQFDRSMRRWDRLHQKYPEFHLVVPEHMGQLL